MDDATIIDVLKQFNINAGDLSFELISHGHIHESFRILSASRPRYILQKLNTSVFPDAEAVQSNIDRALKKLHTTNYRQLQFIKTNEETTLLHKEDKVWRLMTYIEGSRVFNTTEDPAIAYEAGVIIGRFHGLLKSEKLDRYNITLLKLNDLNFRMDQFEAAIKSPAIGIAIPEEEIRYARNTYPIFDKFLKTHLPVRLCHNDTKLSNILFDDKNKALCLIDLDTIMPGYFHYDFGDAIRTIVNPVAEDEKDLSRIKFSLTMFEAFIKGFKFSGLKLSDKEIEFLPLSAALMPFLHGLRMLTDYLNGNIYFKVSYREHNLDRCRSLFRFTELALNYQNEMKAILSKLK